jgi:hypothetical protein
MVKLAYVPAGFAQEPEAVTGMASISAGAESAQMEEQQLYKNGDQFLLVKTSTDDGSPLPQGEAAKVNGRTAVLSAGLSGAVDMAPAVPEGADAEGAAAEGAASGGTQIVTASGAATGGQAAPEAGSGPVTVTGSGSGPSLQTSGSPGSLPELPSLSYEDAISLTWVVDGTRVELLSNLPATELQKIAEGLTLNT